MSDTPDPSITQKEKVTVLLSEYTTLRTEIIQRTGHGFQLLSVGVAVVALVNAIGIDSWKWVFSAFAILVVIIAICITLQAIKQLSARVRELESEINARVCEPLLRWETRTNDIAKKYGVAEMGRTIEERQSSPTAASGPDRVI